MALQQPLIEICLQLPNRLVELLAKRYLVKI
jgi:hypothetical protein